MLRIIKHRKRVISKLTRQKFILLAISLIEGFVWINLTSASSIRDENQEGKSLSAGCTKAWEALLAI